MSCGGLIIREEQWKTQPRAQSLSQSDCNRCCFPQLASVNYQQHSAGNALLESEPGEHPLVHGEDPEGRLPPSLPLLYNTHMHTKAVATHVCWCDDFAWRHTHTHTFKSTPTKSSVFIHFIYFSFFFEYTFFPPYPPAP